MNKVMKDEIKFDDASLNIIYDPKKEEGLIQVPENATLKEVIELINDINLNITADEELRKKWKHWMPNIKKEKGDST